jgi:hypothetical protein
MTSKLALAVLSALSLGAGLPHRRVSSESTRPQAQAQAQVQVQTLPFERKLTLEELLKVPSGVDLRQPEKPQSTRNEKRPTSPPTEAAIPTCDSIPPCRAEAL